ncbi:hypothetical protein OAS51_01285 [Candidatus Thioglobus sp.]|nr:hypothetical protein [Candidatus Thioglobus sp.]
MSGVFRSQFNQIKKRNDIILQFAVSILRPIFFTVAIIALKDEYLFQDFIYAIGYIGFFAIIDSLFQSYIRSHYLNSSGNKNLNNIHYISALFLFFLFFWAGDADPMIFLLISVYLLNSSIFIYERILAQKKCIVLSSGSELLIGFSSVFLIYLGIHNEILIFLVFASFPIGRLVGLTIHVLISRLSNVPLSDSTIAFRSSKRIESAKYISYSILQQSVASIAVSLPVIFFNVMDNYNFYIISLIYMRWLHTSGALASIIVNVLGSRIFYRSININYFIKSGHWLSKNERILKALILLSFVVLFYSLIYFENPKILITMIFSGAIIVTLNYFASLLFSFGRPDLTLLCQIMILALSSYVCSIIFNSPLFALFSIMFAFFIFIFKYKLLIKACKDLC